MDFRAADRADRRHVVDLELLNRINGHERNQFPCLRAGGAPRCARLCFATTPAARITFSTPAAKPSSRNTISPHGEIPSQRSSDPTDHAADQNACHQFARQPKSARHCRSVVGGRRTSASRLLRGTCMFGRLRSAVAGRADRRDAGASRREQPLRRFAASGSSLFRASLVIQRSRKCSGFGCPPPSRPRGPY